MNGQMGDVEMYVSIYLSTFVRPFFLFFSHGSRNWREIMHGLFIRVFTRQFYAEWIECYANLVLRDFGIGFVDVWVCITWFVFKHRHSYAMRLDDSESGDVLLVLCGPVHCTATGLLFSCAQRLRLAFQCKGHGSTHVQWHSNQKTYLLFMCVRAIDKRTTFPSPMHRDETLILGKV